MILSNDEVRVLYGLLKDEWIPHDPFYEYFLAIQIVARLRNHIEEIDHPNVSSSSNNADSDGNKQVIPFERK